MKKWVTPLTMLALILGLILTQQIKVQDTIALAASAAPDRNQILVNLITKLESEIALEEQYLASLRSQTEDIAGTTRDDQSILKHLEETLNKRQIEAGLIAIEGPGLIITLDDNKTMLQSGTSSTGGDVAKYLIHFQDILYLLEDLKRGGGEAFSVNDQRVIASSEIRCVGNTILINTTRLAPPFEIRVIGLSDKLLEVLTVSDTYNRLKTNNFPVSYTSHSTIQLPAYTANIPTEYLTPVPAEGSKD